MSCMSLAVMVRTHCVPSRLTARSRSSGGISYITPPNENANEVKLVVHGTTYEPSPLVDFRAPGMVAKKASAAEVGS